MLGITAIAQSPIASLGGTNASIEVTGIALTTATGSVSITAIQNPTIQLTGVTASTTLGTIQVDPDVIVTGEQLTTVIGPYSVQADATTTIVAGSEKELETSTGTLSFVIATEAFPSGQELTTAVGSVAVTSAVAVSGVQANTSTGTTVLTGDANVDASTNLLTISDQAVDVSINVSFAVTGLTTLTTAINSVTVDLNTPVDITGQQMSISVGNTGTIAWSNVDPGVANVWVEVDIAA